MRIVVGAVGLLVVALAMRAIVRPGTLPSQIAVGPLAGAGRRTRTFGAALIGLMVVAMIASAIAG